DRPPQRAAVAVIVRVDRHASHALQLLERHKLIRREETTVSGDDEMTGDVRGRIGEPSRVSKLPAEVQPAEETENLSDRRSLRGPQFHRELEARFGTVNQLRALTAAMRR